MAYAQGLHAICTLGVLLGALAGRALAATSWIVPGAVWTDTSGTKIDAHGGQVFQTGTHFYWVSHVLLPQCGLVKCTDAHRAWVVPIDRLALHMETTNTPTSIRRRIC